MNENNSGYKYLFKNIGILTISQFATKLLTFLLVPLYTSILTTAEYGTYDMFMTIIGIMLPIFTLNIQEAVVRFSLDKNYDKDAIVTTAVRYFIFSNLLVGLFIAINSVFNISVTIITYAPLFFLIFFVQSLSGITIAYIRGIEKVAVLAISGTITSLVTIVCNFIFLVLFKWGLLGYFLANILGPLVQSAYLIIISHMPSHIKFDRYEFESKEMIAYSKPLIANSIAWWINGFLDRFVIIFFCGLSANGIYSVAGKIPQILEVFQSIFNQAWTLSAVKEFDPDDKNGFFTNTYKAYNCLLVIICSGIIMFDKILAKVLYLEDFYSAWIYVPWLTIAIVFGALSGYIGGFFSAVKESKIFAISTVMGATVNVVLNFVFIPLFGPLAAAIATVLCYVVIWLFRYIQSRKYIKLKICIYRDMLSYVFLVVQSVMLLVIEGGLLFLIEGGFCFAICMLYFKDIILIVNKIRRKSK